MWSQYYWVNSINRPQVVWTENKWNHSMYLLLRQYYDNKDTFWNLITCKLTCFCCDLNCIHRPFMYVLRISEIFPLPVKINKLADSRLISSSAANNSIFLPKLFWPTVRKNCSSDREKLLKFEGEGQEFANFFRSLKVS